VTPEQTPGEGYIGPLSEAPDFMKDKYIYTGYRIGYSSKRKIARTFFKLHNESVNVWTHMFGLSIFIMLIIHTCLYLAPPGIYKRMTGDLIDRWTLGTTDGHGRSSEIFSNILGNLSREETDLISYHI
jgi:hypothetical protein